MTASTILDYEADAADRLQALMAHQNIGFRDRLKQSAAAAGAQLELAKPSVMGDGKRGGLYAGPATMAPVGTVIIVLATARKVLTIWLQAGVDTPLAECVEQAVAYVETAVESDARAIPYSQASKETLFVAEHLINKYGRRSGKRGAELSNEHNTRIIGMLFAALPSAERAHIIKGLETAIAQGVCPVLVCLLGRGSKTGMCGAWPLFLPLAPYADAVLAP